MRKPVYQQYLAFLNQIELTKVPKIQIGDRKVSIDIESPKEWKISILVGKYDEELVDSCGDLFFKQDGGLCYCNETQQIYLVFYHNPPQNFADFELMLTTLLEKFQILKPLMKI
jgi:hypothetical protein